MKRYSDLITAVFYLFAVTAIVLWFVIPHDRAWFYIFGGAAVVIRIAQYIARLVGTPRRKHEIPDDLK